MTAADRKLVWFGLLGAPLAWAVQHVAGFGITQAGCDPGGGGVAIDRVSLAIAITAALIAAAAGTTSYVVFRHTLPAPEDPPPARIHFLAILGMTVAPLFVFIILMSGIGTVVLANCHQS